MHPPFESEEQGIIVAQRALDQVRVFLRRRTAVITSAPNDDDLALRFQFEYLEDMLRVISDSRYARDLSRQNFTRRFGNGSNLEVLQSIVAMAQEMKKSGRSAQRSVPNDPRWSDWSIWR